jgi:putative membrane protein
MQFLKTLFWIALTVVLVLFAKANWNAVTIKLWGGLEADVKLPVLVLAAFLLGFVPTFIIYRARLWGLRRRLDPAERRVPAAPATAAPVVVDNGTEARVATDSKAWPTA